MMDRPAACGHRRLTRRDLPCYCTLHRVSKGLFHACCKRRKPARPPPRSAA
jgi:hypothetical protein